MKTNQIVQHVADLSIQDLDDAVRSISQAPMIGRFTLPGTVGEIIQSLREENNPKKDYFDISLDLSNVAYVEAKLSYLYDKMQEQIKRNPNIELRNQAELIKKLEDSVFVKRMRDLTVTTITLQNKEKNEEDIEKQKRREEKGKGKAGKDNDKAKAQVQEESVTELVSDDYLEIRAEQKSNIEKEKAKLIRKLEAVAAPLPVEEEIQPEEEEIQVAVPSSEEAICLQNINTLTQACSDYKKHLRNIIREKLEKADPVFANTCFNLNNDNPVIWHVLNEGEQKSERKAAIDVLAQRAAEGRAMPSECSKSCILALQKYHVMNQLEDEIAPENDNTPANQLTNFNKVFNDNRATLEKHRGFFGSMFITIVEKVFGKEKTYNPRMNLFRSVGANVSIEMKEVLDKSLNRQETSSDSDEADYDSEAEDRVYRKGVK